MNEFFESIKRGLLEAIAFAEGKETGAIVHEFPPKDDKDTRKRVRNGVRTRLFLAFTLAFAVTSHATELILLPASVALSQQGQEHQLLLGQGRDGHWVGPAAGDTQWASSAPAIVSVDAAGKLVALADGEATITATNSARQASVTVSVKGAGAPPVRSFVNDVQPVLYKTGCSTGPCHGAASGKNGFVLSLRGYDSARDHATLTRQAKGRRVSIVNPADSLMLLKPLGDVPHEGGQRFDKDSLEHKILLDWITQGAPGPTAEDVKFTQLEVLPSSLELQAGATQPLLVRAHYSDGTARDVTRWVKFGTTADTVALVDDHGLVTVQQPGSAAITAWYASRVAVAELNVPRATPVTPEVYLASASYNFIDERIKSKLQQLNIAPAPLCDDAAYIRRAYIDTLGILPAPGEVQAFVADTAKDKRTRLADAILSRPEFVDYWTYQWSDILLISSKNLPVPQELNAFYRYVREAVEQNRPWDQFVRGILTASGNTETNGAANYFLMHREIPDLTETTAQAFLGTSITCARCHNHPLEKWTQNQYYGFANLFSRVRVKNGKMVGNDIVAASFGDVLHPLTGKAIPPQPLDGTVAADAPGTDRRQALADWVTAPSNPYFTRAIVNRIWKNFMGRGLVEPVDDLRLTNPATNEPLMDALCLDLVEHGYDLKKLMHSILTSAAYQRSSEGADPAVPDEINYSQYIVRRLKAEVLLDTYAQVTEAPTPFNGYPAGYRALQLRDSLVASYFLDAFGRPERRQTCTCERTDDASIAQTLHLANGDTLNKKLQAEGSILAKYETEKVPDNAAVNDIFWRAFGRAPSETEQKECVTVLASATQSESGRRPALEDIAWALLTSKEFLFNH